MPEEADRVAQGEPSPSLRAAKRRGKYLFSPSSQEWLYQAIPVIASPGSAGRGNPGFKYLRAQRAIQIVSIFGLFLVLTSVVLSALPAQAMETPVRSMSVGRSEAARTQSESAKGASQPKAKRVVVFSLPYLTWEDYNHWQEGLKDSNGTIAPGKSAIRDQVSGGAVANMSVRTTTSRTTLEQGYATLSAGNRADAGVLGASAFDRDEQVDNSTACRVYERRTGRSCRGEVLQLGIADIVRNNKALLYDARAGALASALVGSGLSTAAIGNADGPIIGASGRMPSSSSSVAEGTAPAAATAFTPSTKGDKFTVTRSDREVNRPVALSAMDEAGQVTLGKVSEALLKPDPSFPSGVTLSPDAVEQEYRRVLGSSALTVIEASDLVRLERALPETSPAQARKLKNQVLNRADELFGRIWRATAELGPEEQRATEYILLSPAAPTAGEELTFFAMAGPGVQPGVALSPSTRRTGVITLTDIAPTILDLLGVKRPATMSGRPVAVEAPNVYKGFNAGESFVKVNSQAQARDELAPPALVAYVVTQAIVFVLAGFALWRRRSSRLFAFLGVWLMLLPVSLFLLRLMPFEAWSPAASIGVAWLIALALAGATWPTYRWWRPAPAAAAAVLTFVVLVFDIMTGSWLEYNSALGYSPIVAGRFTGFGNIGWGIVISCAILVATFAVMRFGRQNWVLWSIGVLFGVTVFATGWPAWGADVGGVLSGAPGLAVTWLLLAGKKIRWRTVLYVLGASAVVMAILATVDLLGPSESRTHLGRLIESIYGGGFEAFATVIQRKMAANLAMLTTSFVSLVPVTIGFLIVLTLQEPGLRNIWHYWPIMRQGMIGLLVVAVLGMALNDSGMAITAIMLGIVAPMLLFMRSIVGKELGPDAPHPLKTKSSRRGRLSDVESAAVS